MTDGTRNLTMARGSKSVWDRPGLGAMLSACDRERWMAGAAGSVLAMLGTRRGGAGGGLLAALGGVLAMRAAMGRRDVAALRGWIDRALTERGFRSQDIVHESSDESFPASDSPAWTSSGVR